MREGKQKKKPQLMKDNVQDHKEASKKRKVTDDKVENKYLRKL